MTDFFLNESHTKFRLGLELPHQRSILILRIELADYINKLYINIF